MLTILSSYHIDSILILVLILVVVLVLVLITEYSMNGFILCCVCFVMILYLMSNESSFITSSEFVEMKCWRFDILRRSIHQMIFVCWDIHLLSFECDVGFLRNNRLHHSIIFFVSFLFWLNLFLWLWYKLKLKTITYELFVHVIRMIIDSVCPMQRLIHWIITPVVSPKSSQDNICINVLFVFVCWVMKLVLSGVMFGRREPHSALWIFK